MGTVALPGSDMVYAMLDPVIIVAQSDALGLELPQGAVRLQTYAWSLAHVADVTR
jgi:hypothetical protein